MTTIDKRLTDLEQVTNVKDDKTGTFLVVYEHEDKPNIYILDEREVDQVELDQIAENYETVIYIHYRDDMADNELDYDRLGEVDHAEC